MIITKQDKKIAKLLVEKTELITQGREISKRIEEDELNRNKLALRVQKIKDKIMPFARKIKKKELEKYEDIQSIDLDESGNIILTTFNYMDEYKKALDEKIKNGKL